GEMHDLLRVDRLLIERQDDGVGDDIIVEIGAERARIADIAHLDRGRTMGGDLRTSVGGVPAAVDEDVDPHLVDQGRYLAVSRRSKIVELVECSNKPSPNIALVVWSDREAQDLKSGTVMDLEQLRGQKSRGMPMKSTR